MKKSHRYTVPLWKDVTGPSDELPTSDRKWLHRPDNWIEISKYAVKHTNEEVCKKWCFKNLANKNTIRCKINQWREDYCNKPKEKLVLIDNGRGTVPSYGWEIDDKLVEKYKQAESPSFNIVQKWAIDLVHQHKLARRTTDRL